MPEKIQTDSSYKALQHHQDLFNIFSHILESIVHPDFNLKLRELGREVDQFTISLLDRMNNLEYVLKIISFLNETITCHIIQSSEKILMEKFGLVQELPFCWINMGSDARQEQVVRTDQDNAIIYADPVSDAKIEKDLFFKQLSTLVVEDLEAFGFKKCVGNVMATNPVWRKSIYNWMAALDQWVGSSEPQDVRKLTIMLDLKPVYGDLTLAERVHSRVFELFAQSISVSHYLTRDDKLFKSPKNLFGRIRTHQSGSCKKCFNLKTSGLVHLINGIRILAVNNCIKEPSTLGRMTQLKEKQVISPTEYSTYKSAFTLLMKMKIAQHFIGKKIDSLPDNCVDLSRLTNSQKKELSNALEAVKVLQKNNIKRYNAGWMNFFN